MQEKEGNIRSCMQCHFIFDNTEYDGAQDCILCGRPTLNAYHLHGKSTRKFLKSQQPFKQLAYAEAKQTALRNINSRLKQAVEIKRNIVKYKLNISSHNDALDAASLDLNHLKVSKGSLHHAEKLYIPYNPTPTFNPPLTFEEWAAQERQRIGVEGLTNTIANPVFHTGDVGVSYEDQKEKEEPKTKKT